MVSGQRGADAEKVDAGDVPEGAGGCRVGEEVRMRGEAGEGRDEVVEVPDGVLDVGCGCVGFFAWEGGVAWREERGVQAGVDFVERLA